MKTLEDRYEAAPTFREFLNAVEKNETLWRTFADRARVSDHVKAELESLPPLRLLVLSEDWCGDAVNTLPLVARMAEVAPNLDLRVLSRDENPDLMDSHLTGGSRSIPVVIVYDENMRELAWWGPRPTLLQDWVMEEGLSMASRERYREMRRWYAVDRGDSTVREVLAKLQAAVRDLAA